MNTAHHAFHTVGMQRTLYKVQQASLYQNKLYCDNISWCLFIRTFEKSPKYFPPNPLPYNHE